MNILFVCSRNQWRSPTAEEIYKNHSDIQVRSAGTESSARIKLKDDNLVGYHFCDGKETQAKNA